MFFLILRSLIISSIAVIMGSFLSTYLSWVEKKYKIFIILIFCCLFPSLAIGYEYKIITNYLIQYPMLITLLYCIIMICRLAVPASLILYFIPQSVSLEGIHCFKLLRSSQPSFTYYRKFIHFGIQGLFRPYCVTFSLVFLMAFSEFEIASILDIKHWTVNMFDSFAGGLPTIEVMKLCWLPLGIEILTIIILISFIGSDRIFPESPDSLSGYALYKQSQKRNVSSFFPGKYIFIIAVILLVLFLPVVLILRGAVSGIVILFREFWMFDEIISSILFALAGAFGAFMLAIFIHRTGSDKKYLFLKLLLIPGLLGGVPLALSILWVFQNTALHFVYNTPLPLLIGLILLFLPYAFILTLLLHFFIPGESIYIATLTGNIRAGKQSSLKLLWVLKYSKRFWLFFLLFCWAYFDLTLSTILAPSTMTTITTRLYNIIHYGESEKLSATVLITILIPLVLIGVLCLIVKFNRLPNYKTIGRNLNS